MRDLLASIGILVAILAIPLLLLSFSVIRPGTVGVVTRFGNVTGEVLEPGPHFIIPFADSVTRLSTKKVIYETSTEENQKNSEADYKDYPVDTNTSDGQQVDIFYTIRFSVDPTQATGIIENIGNEEALVEKIVKAESRVWARNIPRNFTAEQLYTGEGSEQVQNEIFNRLQPVFEANGLILDSVGLREIRFTNAYVQAVEAKQIEDVNVTTAQKQAERAKFEKDAEITRAEAQAEAQRLQRETLSDQVLEKLALENQRLQSEALKTSAEKGQPIVPTSVTILGGADAVPFLNIGQ